MKSCTILNVRFSHRKVNRVCVCVCTCVHMHEIAVRTVLLLTKSKFQHSIIIPFHSIVKYEVREIGIIAMKQGIDSVEKLQKKRFFFSRKTRVSETLKKCNSYRISSHSIHNNWIILYIFSLGVDQIRHSRANITTMHNLFSITSTLRIELNWIQFEHFFATCFYIITCNFANYQKKFIEQQQWHSVKKINNNNVIHLGNHFHRMLNYTIYMQFTHCIKNIGRCSVDDGVWVWCCVVNTVPKNICS